MQEDWLNSFIYYGVAAFFASPAKISADYADSIVHGDNKICVIRGKHQQVQDYMPFIPVFF